MTFVSTYSGGSIRGWQAPTSAPIFFQSEQLYSNSNVANQYFGIPTISYDSNYIAVGETDTYAYLSGKTIVFKRDVISNTFVSQQILTPNNYAGNYLLQFGQSVSLNYNGTTLIVGAPGYDSNSNPPGTAYIFTRSGTVWSQQANLLSGDANSNNFGTVVESDYSGNLMAIGSYDNQGAIQSGAVYIYSYDGSSWTKTQKLKSNVVSAGAFFGSSIAISKDNNANYIAITARGESGGGSIYVFNKSGNTYAQQQRLTNPSPSSGINFGTGLAINNDGNILIAGLPSANSSTTGRAFVYTRNANTWSLNQTILPSVSLNNSSFGDSIAMNNSGNIAFIGDPLYPTSNLFTGKGAVYVFEQISSYVQNQIILANNGSNIDFFGETVVCDGNASTLVISAPGFSVGNVDNAGTVYIFNS